MQELEKILEEIETLNYHPEGMGCGLEDCGITDRYEACEYGWDQAIEAVVEVINNMGDGRGTNTPAKRGDCSRRKWYQKGYEDGKSDGWISVDERLPEEKVNPITQDFYEYQVTVNFGFGEDVRTYKYGNGHWWHGPGIADKYVIAWRERPDPYYPKRRGK